MRSPLLPLVTLVACRDPEPGKTADTGLGSGTRDTDTGTGAPAPPAVYNESTEAGWIDVRTGGWATCAQHETGSVSCWGLIYNDTLPTVPDSALIVAVRVSPVWGAPLPVGWDMFAMITDEGALYGTEYLADVEPDGFVIDADGYSEGLFDDDSYVCMQYEDGRLDCEYPYDGDYSDRVFQSMSCGWRPCGILDDSTLDCLDDRPVDHGGGAAWRNPPEGLYAQLSCSKLYFYMDHIDFYFKGCCAVAIGGELACWGDPDSPDPPAGTFTHVSAGSVYLCAVRDTGELACWGDPGLRPDPPDRTFVNVDTQGGHTCGITTEGTILCWGDDSFGQATPP